MKSPILFSGAAALCLLAPAQSFGNVMISIQPTSQTVQGVGSLQLEISGLGNGAAPALSAFDFTLLFDPTLITHRVTLRTHPKPTLSSFVPALPASRARSCCLRRSQRRSWMPRAYSKTQPTAFWFTIQIG